MEPYIEFIGALQNSGFCLVKVLESDWEQGLGGLRASHSGFSTFRFEIERWMLWVQTSEIRVCRCPYSGILIFGRLLL